MINVRKHTLMYFEITVDRLRKYSLSITSEIVIYINIRNYKIQDRLLSEQESDTRIKDSRNFNLQGPIVVPRRGIYIARILLGRHLNIFIRASLCKY